jgi:hypothetical protein
MDRRAGNDGGVLGQRVAGRTTRTRQRGRQGFDALAVMAVDGAGEVVWEGVVMIVVLAGAGQGGGWREIPKNSEGATVIVTAYTEWLVTSTMTRDPKIPNGKQSGGGRRRGSKKNPEILYPGITDKLHYRHRCLCQCISRITAL